MTKPIVRVPERGAKTVSREVWRLLEPEAPFWALVEAGIVSVSQVSRGGVELAGGSHVGRAAFEKVELEIVEKTPGALASLLYLGVDDVRLIEGEAPSVSPGQFGKRLVSDFLQDAKAYASAGLDFRYAERERIGTLITGRLNARRTISLRASGRGHVVAFSPRTITQDTPVNRAVLAALREVERLDAVLELDREQVVTARALAAYFSDARTPAVMFARRSALAEDARRTAASAGNARWSMLLRFSAALLENEAFDLGEERMNRVPRSWFINLERLFERAVRVTFAKEIAGTGCALKSGRDTGRTLFREPASVFRVDPDVVVVRDGGVMGVADVKYKIGNGVGQVGSIHGDVYQVLAHAAALESRVACLVFPGDEFDERLLRHSATGADLLLASVDPRTLKEDVAKIVHVVLKRNDELKNEDETLRVSESEVESEREVGARQVAATEALIHRVAKISSSQLDVIDSLVRRVMPTGWSVIDGDERSMLRTAVYFGLHASDEGIDYSGPILGLFSVCERILGERIFRPMAAGDSAFRRVTFGEAAVMISRAEGGDRKARAVRDWLDAAPGIEAVSLRACADEMKKLNSLRVAAAHTDLLKPGKWTYAFERIVPEPDGLLPRLAACFSDEEA